MLEVKQAGRGHFARWYEAAMPTRIGSVPAWAVAVFGLALLLRVGFVVGQLQLHLFNVNFDSADSALYRSLGESILAGHYGGSAPTAYVTPGYPLLLALLFEVSHATLFIALVQSVLGAVTCVLLGSVAGRLAGIRAAWATGVIAAIYPNLVFWTGYVLTETLYVFGIALSLWLLARLLDRPSPERGLVTGLAFGATALARPTIVGFAIVLVICGLIVARTRVATTVAFLGMVLALAPWVIRNEIVLHSFVVGSTETGQVLYQGNSPGANGGSGGYVGAGDYTPLRFGPRTTEMQAYNLALHKALRWMAHHPGRVLELIPAKLWNMFRPTYTNASTLDKLVTYTTYPLLLLLGVIGLVLASRRGALGWALIVFFVYHLVFHGLVTGMIRFRLPVEAVLTITAGLAIAQLTTTVAERRRGGRNPIEPALT